MAARPELLQIEELAPTPAPRAPRKKLVRRAAADRSQRIRHVVQAAFLGLNLLIGFQFYLWVRWCETGGQSIAVARPAGVEGWLPIASLMNLKALVLTGEIPRVHPAGLFLLIAFLAISFLMRKAFCSWLCPVGTFSEYLADIGHGIFGHTLRVPRWLDIPLRALKYVLLGLFLYAVLSMPVIGIRAFLEGPYGLVADVKMMNFFRFLGTTSAIVIAVLVLLSFVVANVWCRYLCPYGALLGLVSLLSPLRIRRVPDACIDCAKCAKACPSALPVDRLMSVRSAECSACMSCVAVCPAEGALDLSALGRRRVPAWAMATAMLVLFVSVVGFARAMGYWHTDVPDALWFDLVPRAEQFGHP